MPTDMRPYAERLAQAMPERFEFSGFPFAVSGDASADTYVVDGWALIDRANVWKVSSYLHPAHQWAFWGPLAVELKIMAVWCAESHEDLLEAIAEAVCQEAERRAKEVPE